MSARNKLPAKKVRREAREAKRNQQKREELYAQVNGKEELQMPSRRDRRTQKEWF